MLQGRKRSIKPRPYQQQRRSNIVEWYKSNDSFDKSNVASTLLPFFGNNVAVFGNNVADFGNKVKCCFEKVAMLLRH